MLALADNQCLIRYPERLERVIRTPKRFKVIIGGRGSAKSQTVATVMAATVAGEGRLVLCAREHMNTIEDSVHSLLCSMVDQYAMPGFIKGSNTLRHHNGGGFVYRGLARSTEGIKSMHGISRTWVEEAQVLSEESIKLLTPTIREDDSEIWFTANPRSAKDPFSLRFIKPFERTLRSGEVYEDDLHIAVMINYNDNPWFPQALDAEREWDYRYKSRAEYNHVWLGHYDDSIQSAIIAPEWFDSCVDAHKRLGFEPRGIEVVSHDPADSGDAKGLAYRHGAVFIDVMSTEAGNVNEAADWALDYALRVKPDVFTWDADGLGLALRQQVNDRLAGKRIDQQAFHGAGSVDDPLAYYEPPSSPTEVLKTNKQTFRNLRAQRYWMLRDRIWRTHEAVQHGKYSDPDDLISFSSDIKELDTLRAEIGRIPRKPNETGLLQVASKEDMRRMRIASPNMADSVMMALRPFKAEPEDIGRYRPRRQRARGSWMSS